MADEQGRATRQTRAPGDRARARIVEHAARLASIEGLEGLSIGRLAEVTGVAKSSVHALFGSKQELQLATINAARENFIVEVVGPALAATSPGRERLLALCEGYLSYVERRVFPGGCFLLQEAHAAADKGELTTADEPAQLAFELGVILAGTDIVAILHDDPGAVSRGRAAVMSRLRGSPI